MTTWILERDVFIDGDEALAVAVRAAGGTVVAWDDDWWWNERWPRLGDGPVVFHGSLANADRIARERPWRPGAFCATEGFACSSWWPTVVSRLAAPAYLATTAIDLVRTGAPAMFGDRVFVRPDSPLKPFSGRVLPRDGVTLAALDHGFYFDDEELPVMVTPVVGIGAEWRFVVAAGVVVAGSVYEAVARAAGGRVTPDHAAWRYAATAALELSTPDPVHVLDVCETDAGLRLLELNPFSGADLYDCDRAAVVDAVERAVS